MGLFTTTRGLLSGTSTKSSLSVPPSIIKPLDYRSVRRYVEAINPEQREQLVQSIQGNVEVLSADDSRAIKLNTNPIAPLRQLNFSYGGDSAEAICYQISECQGLMSLDISYCRHLNANNIKDIIDRLAFNSPDIKSINLNGLFIKDNTLRYILSKFNGLSSLLIGGLQRLTKDVENEIYEWARKNSVAELDLSGLNWFSPEFFRRIATLPNLLSLNLNGSHSLRKDDTNQILIALSQNSPSLIALKVADLNISPATFVNTISSFEHLEDLDLSSSRLSDETIAEALQSKKTLHQLYLGRSQITSTTLGNIVAANPSLEVLDISDCKSIEGAGFVSICEGLGKSNAQLKLLDFSGLQNVTDKDLEEGFENIGRKLSTVKALRLAKSSLNQETLNCIAKYGHALQEISFYHSTPIDENLSFTFFEELSKVNNRLRIVNIGYAGSLPLQRQATFDLKKYFHSMQALAWEGRSLQPAPIDITQLFVQNPNLQTLLVNAHAFTSSTVRMDLERKIPDIKERMIYESDLFPKVNIPSVVGAKKQTRAIKDLLREKRPEEAQRWIDHINKEMTFSSNDPNDGYNRFLNKRSIHRIIDLTGSNELTSDKLFSITRNTRNIESLNINSAKIPYNDLKTAIIMLGANSPGLKALNLSFTQADDETMELVFKTFPHLESLSINSTLNTSERTFHMLKEWIKNNDSLRALEMSVIPQYQPGIVTDGSLALEVLNETRNLEYLSVPDIGSYIVDPTQEVDFVDKLIQKLEKSPQLKGISLYAAHPLTASQVEALYKNCPQIDSLYCMMEDYSQLLLWKQLKNIAGGVIKAEDFKQLAINNKHLECISALIGGTPEGLLEAVSELSNESLLQAYVIPRTDTKHTLDLIQALEKPLQQIKYLAVVSPLSAEAFKLLCEKTSQLLWFSFQDSEKLTAEDYWPQLEKLGQQNPDLRYLQIGALESPYLMAENLVSIGQNFHQLKALDLSTMQKDKNSSVKEIADGLMAIFKANPNLEIISAQFLLSPSEYTTVIGMYPELEKKLLVSSASWNISFMSQYFWGHNNKISLSIS